MLKFRSVIATTYLVAALGDVFNLTATNDLMGTAISILEVQLDNVGYQYNFVDPYNVTMGYLGGTYAFMAAGFYDFMQSISGTSWSSHPLGAFAGVTANDLVSCGIGVVGTTVDIAITIATSGADLALLAGLASIGIGGVGLIFAC